MVGFSAASQFGQAFRNAGHCRYRHVDGLGDFLINRARSTQCDDPIAFDWDQLIRKCVGKSLCQANPEERLPDNVAAGCRCSRDHSDRLTCLDKQHAVIADLLTEVDSTVNAQTRILVRFHLGCSSDCRTLNSRRLRDRGPDERPTERSHLDDLQSQRPRLKPLN